MATIVTRSGKGSPLTHAEVDSNFTNLNTDKLETAGGSMTGNLSFGDNDKAIFGAGSDLQIYHDGDDSYIKDAGTGDLKIQGANVRLENPSGVRYFQGSSGVAYLYNSGDIKLSTSSTGVDITGTLTSDGLTVDGDAVISSANARLRLKETDTTDNDTQLQTTGGVFKISRLDDDNSTATQRFTIDNSTGDISFYEDTGTTAKLHWSAADESLGIGLSSASHVLDVTGDKDTWITKLYNSGSDANASGLLVRSDATAAHDASVLGVYADGGYKMMVKSSGNVGIGTSSPSAPLQVKGSAGEIRLQRPTASQSDWSFKLPSSGGELTFYDNNNAAERMRITSSGSVGIGTSSPSYLVDAQTSSGNAQMQIKSGSDLAQLILTSTDTTGNSQINFADADSNNVGMLQYFHSDNHMEFTVNSAEAMRIDSSGNLLVGTTNVAPAGNNVEGVAIGAGGYIQASYDGFAPMSLNRKTNDGDIAVFNKDGATVGSIGASSGKTVITLDPRSAATTGSGFLGGDGVVFPSDKTGAASDADVSLGGASTRFKDLYLSGTAYVDTAVRFSTSVSTPTGNTIFRPASNTLAFGTNSSEAARIDSSGNLLVGKTSLGLGTEGHELVHDGQTRHTRDDATPLFINRLTSSGNLISFYQDTGFVGSIGTFNADLNIGTGDTGVQFVDGSDAILPHSMTANTFRDNAISLGNSGNRFKDLYLSGGVYLGGTDSDHLLNDYEEGTYTVTTNVGTISANSGFYTKIGDLVYVTAVVGSFSNTSSSDSILLSLPFTSSSVVNNHGSVMSRYINKSDKSLTAYIGASSNSVNIYANGTNGNNWSALTYSDLSSGSAYLRFSICYKV